MFYLESPSTSLRFGDIVRGFVTATPSIAKPNTPVGSAVSEYSLNISHDPFSVILSPCCSIGNKVISLAPLIQILPAFFRNPYFVEDFTRINRMMKPEQTLPPATWDKLTPEEQHRRVEVGLAYAFVDQFIFAEHDLLPEYELNCKDGKQRTRFYMVDFRQVYQVKCEKINTQTDAPIDAKYLELSVVARKELREKIANYYGRTPQEDSELLGV